MQGASFNIGAKGTGSKFAKAIAGPPAAKPIPKDRAPDHVVRDQTTPEQAVLYRLSGDYNPLHIGALLSSCAFRCTAHACLADPAIGKATGFGGTILHGLSTLGFGARAVLSAVAPGAPTALKLFGVRFTSPVRPGDALETRIWEVGPGPDGTTEVTFETVNVGTGKVALGGGIAYVKKGGVKSKL
jgi:peroxisomal enoyl-CoA hydratase 2